MIFSTIAIVFVSPMLSHQLVNETLKSGIQPFCQPFFSKTFHAFWHETKFLSNVFFSSFKTFSFDKGTSCVLSASFNLLMLKHHVNRECHALKNGGNIKTSALFYMRKKSFTFVLKFFSGSKRMRKTNLST